MEGLGRVGEAFTFSSCQNYGPFFGYPTVNIRCRIIIRTQTGTIILTTTQTWFQKYWVPLGFYGFIRFDKGE